jgi:WhiB family redox-sensing transcriptional regulator
MDWRHEAACREEDPEVFFPVGKICERCPVKEPCLAWALESGQDAGVWGGLSEDERRAMKRRAARNRARQMENQNPF